MNYVKRCCARLILPRKRPGEFDAATVRKIVFLRDNRKFGDLIVSTASFREAKQYGMEVSVIVGGQAFASLLEFNPSIDHVYSHGPELWESIRLGWRLRREHYDLAVDFLDAQPTFKRIVLLHLMNPRHALSFNKKPDRSYDVSLTDEHRLNRHASLRNVDVLARLGITACPSPPNYDLRIDPARVAEARRFLESLPHKRTLLLNPAGEGPLRSLSASQIEAIVANACHRGEKFNVVLTGRREVIDAIPVAGASKSPFVDYVGAIALAQVSDLIVTPDTSMVHVAAAFGKPVLALYQPDNDVWYVNSKVWGPNNPKAVQLLSRDERVASIENPRIIEALKHLSDTYL
ncbi:glycosyltransferase family 9 protein [Paludibacterium yongneupense]|uniref:glycosyltransferase family 9 protein n=1 Tax=Paludibacterium yongneupense TaxID=400061 RepID=UPI00041417C1|nr:glycosyltransferase family 9 protein [Paludibacterium yongneupense]